MKTLTKNEILNKDDRPTRVVEVPEWGGSIRLKPMTGRERDEFEAEISKKSKDGKIDIRGLRAFLICLTAVDEEGNLLFTREEADVLNQKSASVLTKLFEIVQEMNGIGEKAVKDLLGNSGGSPKDSSGSGSQGSSAAR